jgi:hypothetical protein
MKKVKLPVPVRLLDPVPDIKKWIVFGLDPSLSRTGFALSKIDDTGKHWLSIGSIKPDDSKVPMWIRSKAMAQQLVAELAPVVYNEQPCGVIFSLEAPTVGNDYLATINCIFRCILLEEELAGASRVHLLHINANTLRSLMGLTKRGPKNKSENKTKAYEFVEKTRFPELDSDSCDAVLLNIMGLYTASILMGDSSSVPTNFLERLCSDEKEVKGKGRNQRIVTRGILHHPEYWYLYQKANYKLKMKDASEAKRILKEKFYLI